MGKTRKRSRRRIDSKKHPHVHGEDHCYLVLLDYIVETPPRAWGRLKGTIEAPGYNRNTPTCMGKT